MPDQIPVGIDLGTTYSAVAHLDTEGRPWTVLNAEGDLTTPSVVFFDESGAVVGKEALTGGEFEPERLAQFAKRDMGEEAFSKTIRGQKLPAEVVQAIILKKLKEDSELKLKHVSQVVITVPAFFNEPCRRATQDAGRLAGLDVLDIINEPTAAAICYGVQQGFLTREGVSKDQELILIYDLGGGTFDVTVMEIDGTNYRAIATAGDVYLGGIDWDERLVDYIAEAFQQEHGLDPREDEIAHQALLLKAAEVKHSLTSRDRVTFFFNHEGKRLKHSVSRETFEELTSDLLDRTIMTVRTVLREAEVDFSQLTRLLLVGGSTRMPAVQSFLEKETGLSADRSLSPDEAVAHGAAIYAGLLMRSGAKRISGMSVVNVNSHDLGILGVETATGRKRRSVMIPRNSALPTRVSKVFPTLREGQQRVDINVIEGGDDSGNHSTPIGRCLVRGLPPDLPAKTPVKVTFEYEQNGRLCVYAKLPTVGVDAELEIARAAGLAEPSIDKWKRLVESGIPDQAVDSISLDSGPEPSSSDASSDEGQPVKQQGAEQQRSAQQPPGQQRTPPTEKASPATGTERKQVAGSTASAEPVASGRSGAAPVRKLKKPVKKLSQPVRPPQQSSNGTGVEGAPSPPAEASAGGQSAATPQATTPRSEPQVAAEDAAPPQSAPPQPASPQPASPQPASPQSEVTTTTAQEKSSQEGDPRQHRKQQETAKKKKSAGSDWKARARKLSND